MVHAPHPSHDRYPKSGVVLEFGYFPRVKHIAEVTSDHRHAALYGMIRAYFDRSVKYVVIRLL